MGVACDVKSPVPSCPARLPPQQRTVPPVWAGQPVGELETEGAVRVCAVSRLGVGQVPRVDLVLQEGDIAYLAVAESALAALDSLLARRPGSSGH